MAHRIYLYNFNHSQLADAASKEKNAGDLGGILAGIGTTDEENLTMVEWNYEFPIFLHALLSDNPFISTPLYNGDEGGIYASALKGKVQLKKFYDFIERHAAILIDDQSAFLIAKQKIFEFLDQRVIHNFFHLDAWDVFNMDEDSHEDQAIDLLEDIEISNALIAEAIDNDNPKLLDAHPDYDLGQSSFQSFREQLNFDGYDYGWRVIHSGVYDDLDDETRYFIIEENELLGIENTEEEIILPIAYTSIEEVDDLGFVIMQNDRFGFFIPEEGIVQECNIPTAEEMEEWIANYRITAAAKAFETYGGSVKEPEAADLHNLAIDAVEKGDMETAFHYYEIAAEMGQPESMNDLGWYYSTPDYYNENKSYYWYRKGAKAGFSMAMTGFGLCHINGVGIQQNLEKGIEWLLKAADLGEADAYIALIRIYSTDPVFKDENKVAELIDLAKKAGIELNYYL